MRVEMRTAAGAAASAIWFWRAREIQSFEGLDRVCFSQPTTDEPSAHLLAPIAPFSGASIDQQSVNKLVRF